MDMIQSADDCSPLDLGTFPHIHVSFRDEDSSYIAAVDGAAQHAHEGEHGNGGIDDGPGGHGA